MFIAAYTNDVLIQFFRDNHLICLILLVSLKYLPGMRRLKTKGLHLDIIT